MAREDWAEPAVATKAGGQWRCRIAGRIEVTGCGFATPTPVATLAQPLNSGGMPFGPKRAAAVAGFMLLDELTDWILSCSPSGRVADLRAGLGYAAAQLDDGRCGVAYTFREAVAGRAARPGEFEGKERKKRA